MQHLHLTLRGLLAGGLLATAGPAFAQGLFPISPNQGHVDTLRRVVLINAPLHTLQATPGDSVRSFGVGMRVFALTRAVARISPARSYAATQGGHQYQLFFTRLPVLELATRHQLADTPSVYTHLRLTDSTSVVQQTAAGVQWRGGTSQSYPKKSYELTLWSDTVGASNQNLSLLGMRSDDKWNLQALYNDQLRSRLKVANELWLQLNQPYYQALEPTAKTGIRLAYTEVFLNGSYEGIYALTERIDNKQLQLKKYNGTIRGELYKGISWDAGDTYAGAPPYSNTSPYWSGFEYEQPSEVTDWSNLFGYVSFVVSSTTPAFYAQYRSHLNQASAVDYYLFWNLLRATDNGGKNLYVAKYTTGEPYFFVPWDLDGVLGNDWSGQNVNITNDLLSNGLYDRLVGETGAGGFWPAAASRWAALRASLITPAALDARFAAAHAALLGNDVYEREQLRWPAYQFDPQQLAYSQAWMAARIAYLDGVFGYTALATAPAVAAGAVQLYPNPASGTMQVGGLTQPGQLTLTDLSGRQVLQVALAGLASEQVDISYLAAGLYLARVQSGSQPLTTQKLLVR